jgi:alkane 1-monooxygenase
MLAFCVAPLAYLLYVAAAEALGDVALYATLPLLAGTFSAFDAVFGLAPLAALGETDWRDNVLPWLYIPLQIAVTLSGAIVAARADSDAVTLVGLALAVGTVAGIFGMLAAHEMIHSTRRAERWLGLAMLAATTYLHFRISHVRVHHPLAATFDDPATARRGESVYRFILRSTVGQFRAALKVEHRRARHAGRPLIGNRIHWYVAASVAIYAGLGLTPGRRAVEFFALQSAVAIFVLEVFTTSSITGCFAARGPTGGPSP